MPLKFSRLLPAIFGKRLADPVPDQFPDAVQAGAIPYARIKGQWTFLVVTSRSNKRWIFPKGRIDPGERPWEAALREAYEEAGVRGRIGTHPVGFQNQARQGPDGADVQVGMFALEVTEQLNDWPEQSQRRRHWATLNELKEILTDASLVELARAATPR